MLNCVEHEKSFITSGPDFRLAVHLAVAGGVFDVVLFCSVLFNTR